MEDAKLEEQKPLGIEVEANKLAPAKNMKFSMKLH